MKKLLLVLPLIALLSACDERQNSRQIEAAKQEEMQLQAVQSVGMPAITNFAEKRLLKDIYELRDEMQPTYTYLAGEQSGVIGEKICDSLGYGIPYATQYTNPQKMVYSDGGAHVLTLPQADPNGLFSPAQADGTWIMCKVPGSDKIAPQFIEPKVITLTFPKEARK